MTDEELVSDEVATGREALKHAEDIMLDCLQSCLRYLDMYRISTEQRRELGVALTKVANYVCEVEDPSNMGHSIVAEYVGLYGPQDRDSYFDIQIVKAFTQLMDEKNPNRSEFSFPLPVTGARLGVIFKYNRSKPGTNKFEVDFCIVPQSTTDAETVGRLETRLLDLL